jgi:hypothetical protein
MLVFDTRDDTKAQIAGYQRILSDDYGQEKGREP